MDKGLSGKANTKVVSRLMLRLLPMQVLLASIGQINGFVSSFFATNYVGIDANAAVGLYLPVSMLMTAVGLTFSSGSAILCGRYIGRGDRDKTQGVFSLTIYLSLMIGIIFAVLALIAVSFDLTGFITKEAAVREIFNRYLLGQVIGIVPLLLSNTLTAFLTIENRIRRTSLAGVVYIIVNLLLSFVFVRMLNLQSFGLALASSIGLWVFLAVEMQYFISGRSSLKLKLKRPELGECAEMLRIGLPGGLSNGYQTLRGFIVNRLIEAYVGAAGISAFTSANNLLAIFWSIPVAMSAISRLMMSFSIGEEDRQMLRDITRSMFRIYLPIMIAIDALLVALAVPFTRLFYQDPAQPVFEMTVWGFRLLPFCMPLAIIVLHFISYGQASGRNLFVHVMAALDGVICVAGFTALLIGRYGMNSVYYANLLNGVVGVLMVFVCAWIAKKHVPRSIDDILVIPDDFGAGPDDRLEFSIDSVEKAVDIAEAVQLFCVSRGVDNRRAYLSGLALEEMAANVVLHGFTKDSRSHSVDVRVIYKDGDVILRITDDCIAFDPGERIKTLSETDDESKYFGIRMVYLIASDIMYQNVLGLNVLTIRLEDVSHKETVQGTEGQER